MGSGFSHSARVEDKVCANFGEHEIVTYDFDQLPSVSDGGTFEKYLDGFYNNDDLALFVVEGVSLLQYKRIVAAGRNSIKLVKNIDSEPIIQVLKDSRPCREQQKFPITCFIVKTQSHVFFRENFGFEGCKFVESTMNDFNLPENFFMCDEAKYLEIAPIPLALHKQFILNFKTMSSRANISFEESSASVDSNSIFVRVTIRKL